MNKQDRLTQATPAGERAPTTLAEAFEASTGHYYKVGYKARIGYGKRPALLVIDMARAWTVPGSPFYCAEVEGVLAAVPRLLEAARAKGLPIVFTITAYEPGLLDAGVWIRKIPSLAHLIVGSDLCRIDPRVAPRPGELVLVKKMASAFNGTHLAQTFAALGVDTVIISGVTTSGCVRHSAEDCVSAGFRPIVPREAVGDRVPGATAWNLFDIDAKVGDVEPLDAVLGFLAAVAPFPPPAEKG
jgi:nicotinamidase-related amidase